MTSIVQSAIDAARLAIQSGESVDEEHIVEQVEQDLVELFRPRLSPLINATGILIHTNLGRAPVSASVAEAMAEAGANYVSLELDPETNHRGGRMSEISRLMRLLTGAESTLVVNNNAAAVLLTLAALASERDVVVSRGEAVEIGGGFRIPDVMRQSGARLVEVGTTNRTYAGDYESAVTDSTAAFLKVHPSNFRIEGFVTSATVGEIAQVARQHNVVLIDDQGSGALVDVARFGLEAEPTIQQSLLAGADVVTASGDKLLGGPQAGIIVGRANLIERIERHPLARSVRADKTTLAGIAATLRHYVAGNATDQIPVLRLLSTTIQELEVRASVIANVLGKRDLPITVIETESSTGGGSLPGQTLPSRGLQIKPFGERTVDDMAFRLRMASPGVFGRIADDALILDLRSVLPEQDPQLIDVVGRTLANA